MYFANGTHGELYEEKWCNRCIHQGNHLEGESCPIWILHLLWNDEQHKDEVKRAALDQFIPRSKGEDFPLCAMFASKQEAQDRQLDAGQMELF